MSCRNYLFRLQLEDLSLIQVGPCLRAWRQKQRCRSRQGRVLLLSWSGHRSLGCPIDVSPTFVNSQPASSSSLWPLAFLGDILIYSPPGDRQLKDIPAKSASVPLLSESTRWLWSVIHLAIMFLWSVLVSSFCFSLDKYKYRDLHRSKNKQGISKYNF